MIRSPSGPWLTAACLLVRRSVFLGEVARMEQRWGEALRNDPAYNPNLSLDSFNFDLAFPPRIGDEAA